MATTQRAGTDWHYGGTNNAWIQNNSIVYSGGNFQFRCRLTLANVPRLDNIGTITGMRIYIDTYSTSSNGGGLYVSATDVAPMAITTDAAYIGGWDTPNGGAQWINVSNFNPAALIQRIGAATTWYCYWENVVTSQRALFDQHILPIFEFDYTPGGMMQVVNGGVWRSGRPHVVAGGVWREGQAYIYTGGIWRPGTA